MYCIAWYGMESPTQYITTQMMPTLEMVLKAYDYNNKRMLRIAVKYVSIIRIHRTVGMYILSMWTESDVNWASLRHTMPYHTIPY